VALIQVNHKLKKLAVVLAISAIFSASFGSTHALAVSQVTSSLKTGEVPYESYTYWEDYGAASKTPVYSKPMYKAEMTIGASALGSDATLSIADICSDENGQIYILDSGSSKIYIIDSNYRMVSVIDKIVLDGDQLTIEGASGIFVKADKLYISDTKNGRVLVLDTAGRVSHILLVPDSKLIPDGFTYSPIRVAVDSGGYIYIASDGSYYGALVYSPEMEFLGFYGANTVAASAMDVLGNIFNHLLSNDTKKGASVLALPYQFNDLAPGADDFIYTATGRSSDWRIQTGQVNMMNPGGRNVLGKESFNFADVNVGTYERLRQIQNVVGIDVDSYGFFCLLEATYGRIFLYDRECNLLSVFGGGLGPRQQTGTMQMANAIAVNGTDILVSDGVKNTVTVFRMTTYGKLVRDVQLKTLNDDFEKTVDEWNLVLTLDQNSQLAYRGLAKAYYARGENHAAAEYAKAGADRKTYGNAFVKIRQEFLERWFPLIFSGVLLLVGAFIAFMVIRRKKGFRLITNERMVVFLSSMSHPFNSFQLVKEKQKGSLLVAGVLLGAYYIISVLDDTASGFAFNYFDASDYNSFYVLLSTIGLVLMWTAANWLVCVLMGGIGRLKEIFIVTCYSLLPMAFASAISLICTHLLAPDEFVFIGILQTACAMYTLFMLAVGTMKAHDFGFGKFLGTSLLTLVAMMIILFLLFLVFLLSQQVYGWVYTLIIEARYR